MLIFSENLASAKNDSFIINKKLEEDLRLRGVVRIPTPSTLFILMLLGLVLKHDRDFRYIYHLSYPKSKSVNNHIPDEVGELRYIRFKEVLDLILGAGQKSIIIKKEMKDAF